MEAPLFYLLATVVSVSALGIVVSRDIVRTAVLLLFALSGVAGLFFLLNAEFLAAVQLVVYVGGTLILILFGVMLTSKAPSANFNATPVQMVVGIAAGALLLALISFSVGRLYAGSSPAPAITQNDPMGALGIALMGPYLLPFELSSMLLLAVMIGAAFLAKGRQR